jgi:hypothetical protein
VFDAGRSLLGVEFRDFDTFPAPRRGYARFFACPANESAKRFAEARKHADDLLVYDNTPNGKGHRLVARFIAGELVKTTHSAPQWVRDVFGRELLSETN